MLDRQRVEAILRRRFAGASDQQVAEATNALMGLDREWSEVVEQERAFGHQPGSEHRDGRYAAETYGPAAEGHPLPRRHI